MKMKKMVMWGLLALLIVGGLFWAWKALLAPTRIALYNFQPFQIAKMVRSAEGQFVRVEAVDVDHTQDLGRYDAVLVFAMGMRITEEQREYIYQLQDKGVAFYTFATTSPENDFTTLDSLQQTTVAAYLVNGGSRNFRSLFNYIRRDIDGKRFFTGEVEAVKEIESDCLFHIGEDHSFTTVEDYEAYLKAHGLYREGQRKIVLMTGIAGPFNTNTDHLDSIIVAFQDRGFRMYPIAGFSKRMEYLEQISPDAVIYLPHGRMLMGQGDRAVDYLRQRNIPLFCPLTLNATQEAWLADKQGMSGGFLSQSLVMPELDGGILPYALIAQEEDPNGILLFKTVPRRLRTFCQLVENHLDLKIQANSEKKIAVYYFKGPGSAALTAAGLEVVPSLYNFLLHLKKEGYRVDGLPSSLKEFERMLMERGPVFNSYAEGSLSRYLESPYPKWVKGQEMRSWLEKDITEDMLQAMEKEYGPVPGDYFTRTTGEGKNLGEEKEIAVTALVFGNVALLPQPIQGTGENSFQAVHGSNPVPPYPYMASYLWTRHVFGADAMIHFGTHGSLEFIPGKQVALSWEDWSDVLVGDMPHFYLYTIANVGEGMIAKRRAYATTVSYLNPPFMESGMGADVKQLQKKIASYLQGVDQGNAQDKDNLEIKKMAVRMGLHRDLSLDSNLSQPYTSEQIAEIDNFATELVQEKIGGGLYTLGEAFSQDKIISSVRLMARDPLAYSLAEVDIAKGRLDRKALANQTFFASRYSSKAEAAVETMLVAHPQTDVRKILLSWGVTEEEYRKACDLAQAESSPTQMDMGMMGDNAQVKNAPGLKSKPSASLEAELDARRKEEQIVRAVLTLKTTLENVNHYRQMLALSPSLELQSFSNALSGGYVPPTSGGDFIANPMTLPTGRNLYAINAETTPTAAAWEKGKKMALEMIDDYRRNHGKMPSKVSFTLWSGSFIESEGATLAQILYMLGVEPIWDRYGRVMDVRLIPAESLGRPRIDVVVQTSGQFRDLAASRLELLQRAISLAAQAPDKGENYVARGLRDAEALLLEKGYSPREARELSSVRVFGGLNGMAGTGITGMVQSGDRWEKESEIAQTYLHNMGAMYGSSQDWGGFKEGVFEAALLHTDVVVQPRQSNTWGALSLDHVYEFMGGLTLSVRHVTGKDPDNYFNDLRNRYNARVQDLRSAIGVEARTTIFNPRYIKERMKGGASSAAGFTEVVSNTYGWNVMKPSAIDNEMWDEIYQVYVKDVHQLGVRDFFEAQSPASLQEMTAIMMETARKGYWKASEEQLAELAKVHSELVEEYGACCNGFTCGNALLKDFVSQHLPQQDRADYQAQVRKALQSSPSSVSDQSSVVLEKDGGRMREPAHPMGSTRMILIVFGMLTLIVVIFSVVLVRRRKRASKS